MKIKHSCGSPGVAPRLHFELLDNDPTGTEGSNGCLAIFNNEQGFTFSNVKAVSSIGKSTKAASKDAGYIGEKGIGFKSVFSVSSSPHIFSNGYHFLFKDKDEATGLGYIIPYWIDQVPELVQERLNAYTTCILLPLRADPEQDVRQKIKKELNSLDPSVLLFLNKLQELTIVIDGQLRRYSKQVFPHATTLVTQQGDVIESIEYLVFKKIVSVPNDLQEDKRQGVVKRDICLAFRKDLNFIHKPDHHLYAYLPTELKTGLPFLVNADFLLPASRESVLTDKKWNLWMRDEVASFAAETLVDLLIETNSVDALAQIPMLENCNHEFLRPIFEVITEKLNDTAFVPSITGMKNKPEEICIADEQITQLLAELQISEIDLPLRVLALNAHPYVKVLKQFCNMILDSDEILSYCNAAKIKLLQLPGNWFVSILHWLSEQDDTFHDKADKNGIKILHKVPLFITEQGIVSCHEQVIFLSSNTHMEYPVLATLESQTNHGLLTNEFQKALEGKQKVINFIKDYFNIQILSQSEYLEKVALPFCVAKCDEILPDTLWQLNRFIAQHWFSISDLVKNMLRAKLPFKNSVGGYELSNQRQLVTPEADERSFIWKNVFSTEEQKQFVVLSDDYLELFEKFEKLQKNEFYKVMKITSAPLPEIIKLKRASRWVKAEFADSNFSEHYVNQTSKAVNKIISTREIEANFYNLPKICSSPEAFSKEPLKTSFLYWLFEVENTLLTSVAINYFYGGKSTKYIESALLNWLKNNKWLPTQNGLMRPDETFIANRGSRELYGNAVNFLDNDFPLSLIMAQKLGVSSEVNSETVLNLLRSWSGHNEKVSIPTVIKLYERLAEIRSDLDSLFAAEALIYCPSGERNWCTSSMAIWKSQKDVLGELFHWLSDFYPDHKQAFWLNNIKVQQNPDAKCFADVWLDLQTLPVEDKDNNGSLRLKLAVIYERLISYIRDKGFNNLEPWFSHFVEHALCFTQNYRWENRDVTYVSDYKKVASLFRDKVEFFWRTRGKSHSDFKLLYDALRLKAISEEVSVAVTFDTEQLKVPSKPVLTEYSRLLLAYYFKQFISKSGKPEEKWYESPGIYDVLTVKEYQICSYMKVTYKVHHFTVKTEVDVTFERNAGFLIYNAENKDVDDLLDDLAEEVSKLIVKKSFVEEQDHIRALLSVQTVERYNKRIEMMHLDNVLTQEEIEIIKMLHLSQDASEPLNTEHVYSNGTPGAEVTSRNPSVIDHSRIDNPEPVEQDLDTPHKFIGIGTNSPSQTNSKSGKTSSSNTANGYSPANEGITATPTGQTIKQGSEREKDEGAPRNSSSSEKVRSDDKQPSVPPYV